MTTRKWLFHATRLENVPSILKKGLIWGHKGSKIPGGDPKGYRWHIWLDASPSIYLWASEFPGKWALIAVEVAKLNQKHLIRIPYERLPANYPGKKDLMKNDWFLYEKNIPANAVWKVKIHPAPKDKYHVSW